MRNVNPANATKVEALESRVLLSGISEVATTPDGAGASDLIQLASSAPQGAPTPGGSPGPNIRVTEAFLTDSNFNRIGAVPIEGQTYGIRVQFTTADLPGGSGYRVQYQVNGVTINGTTQTLGAGQSTGSWFIARRFLFAGAGIHNVQVRVDWDNAIAETDENDNQYQFTFTPPPLTPPHKLTAPIGSQQPWAITAYADLNPLTAAATDYQGKQYTFDNNLSLHFALADLGAMDRGVDALAAMPGTVLAVRDGEFDRNVTLVTPAPPDNFVLIDHGGGWRTRYGRLRNGSVVVSPGQVVSAGQKIGQVGGSGNYTANYLQSDAFLDFDVLYNLEPVETFLNAAAYWQSPPPFAGDVPGVFYMTTTATQPINDATGGFEVDERVTGRKVFHRGDTVHAVTSWHGLNKEKVRLTRFMRPDGMNWELGAQTLTVDRAQGWRSRSHQIGQEEPLGTWYATFEVDGVEIGRASFEVRDPSAGEPEIKAYQGSLYVIDGRSTPIDFGARTQGAGSEVRSFTLINHGGAPLEISRITLPEGFSVVGTPPSTILPGAANAATLEIRRDEEVAGRKSGWVTIHSNDKDNPGFTFAVKGTVVGLPANVLASEFDHQSLPHRLRFTFDRDVGASLSAADVTVATIAGGAGPVSVSPPVWDPLTRTATFEIGGPEPLPDGDFRATLAASGVLNGDTAMAADHAIDFFVLAADANRDRAVNFDDLAILAQNYNKTGGMTFDQGDFNYDGNVNFDDLALLAQRYNTSLPPLAGLSAAPVSAGDSQVLAARRRSDESVFNAVVPIRRPAVAPKAKSPRRVRYPV